MRGEVPPGTRQNPLTRSTAVMFLIVACALALRVHVSMTQPQIWDEARIAIPLAKEISFDPNDLYLPIRGLHHPALPSYVVKASGALFGDTPLGYRGLHILLGVLSVALVFHITNTWFGLKAAAWAASLLAFNEYHVGVSSFDTAKGPHLFLMLLAIYFFTRFLGTDRPRYLYGAGAFVGLAFYCKEHSILLLPVFLVTLAVTRRPWLKRVHVYAAAALAVILIVPDVAWNLANAPAPDQAQYADHFSRIGGLGFSVYPFLFFAHTGMRWLYQAVTGTVLPDEVAENPSMNGLLGVLLFGLVCYRTMSRTGDARAVQTFLVAVFWVVFAFFALISPGQPTRKLDPVAWYWVDVVLYPAVMLAGSVLASTAGRAGSLLRVAAIASIGIALARTAIWWPFVDENLLEDELNRGR